MKESIRSLSNARQESLINSGARMRSISERVSGEVINTSAG